jgi:hypothetical protein
LRKIQTEASSHNRLVAVARQPPAPSGVVCLEVRRFVKREIIVRQEVYAVGLSLLLFASQGFGDDGGNQPSVIQITNRLSHSRPFAE